jgi:UDP-N-acetylglucosamine 2-epimerase
LSPNKDLTLVSVVGARPQFVKLAPVCRSLADLAPTWRHRIVHTGQHYDYGMSEVFFEDLNIPLPDINLNIGSGAQGAQTGAMIAALERELESAKPDGVIVYGDTNSSLAAAIVASKLLIPQFHVEAGLRSFDRTMPEEINRIVSDHCAELLFAPTDTAMANLAREGLSTRARLVGDVMYDAVLYNADVARHNSNVLAGLGVNAGEYAVVTIHRPANTGAATLAGLMQTLADIARNDLPIVFPMHPRTRATLGEAVSSDLGSMKILEPQPYVDMLALVQNARMVLTDSGGLQKEAAFLGTPCITMRDTTEWTETVEIGANELTGFSAGKIRAAVRRIMGAETTDWNDRIPALYGDGRAADRVATDIINWLSGGRKPAESE